KVVSFQTEMETGTVSIGRVRLDKSALPKVYDPNHPLADTTGHYDGSNVDLVIEIADAREAQRSYEANLRLFDQARQMTQSLFDLIRR
ncbi:MAG: flagellar basal body rod C-terminal domain-containing protein, partial [Paracoccaceae bacterium]